MVNVTGIAAGGIIVSAVAPDDHGVLWIDTTVNVAKFWDGSKWTPVKAVWG